MISGIVKLLIGILIRLDNLANAGISIVPNIIEWISICNDPRRNIGKENEYISMGIQNVVIYLIFPINIM